MTDHERNAIVVRPARPDDGAGMWETVRDSAVLDLNSSYLYLLQASDFRDTCAVAERAGEIVGLVTGYRPPARPDSIFLWQVGIRPSAQGQGLGKRLVGAFLGLPGAAGAKLLETTITPSNEASRGLFRSIARDLEAECTVRPFFTADQFPESGHEDEELFEIGPLDPARINRL